MRRDHHVWLDCVWLGLPLVLACTGRSGLSTRADGSTGASPERAPAEGGTGIVGPCASLAEDPMNCGACGHACTPGIACVAGVCQQSKCSGALAFQKVASYPPGPSAASAYGARYLGADVNRDGRLDLLEYGDTAGPVVWLGRDDGSFASSTSFATAGTGETWNLPGYAAVGDFNEDGLADLVLSNSDLRDVRIVTGRQGGGWVAGPGDPISRLLMGDLDRDGHLDLVFSPAVDMGSTTHVLIRRGSGQGTFASTLDVAFPNDDAAATALLDWDANGTLDVVVSGRFGLHVLPGNGEGSFADDQPCPVVVPSQPVFADLNQDGQLDIAWRPLGSKRLATIFGQGGCNFGPRTDYLVTAQLDFILDRLPEFVLGDLDGDLVADILLRNAGTTTPVLTGKPDGTFAAQPNLPIDSSDWSNLLIADVNRDGRADVVSAGPRGIEVYANTCDL